MDLDVTDGVVPAEQVEQLVESIRQDPPHPGLHVASICERLAVTVDQAVRKLGTSPASRSRAGLARTGRAHGSRRLAQCPVLDAPAIPVRPRAGSAAHGGLRPERWRLRRRSPKTRESGGSEYR